jgi:replication initiation and membrane attachment protein DnaB
MSPTVFRYRKYRFYFFSREESRMHIHVISPEGEAKFWLEPRIELAVNSNLSAIEARELERIVDERQDEIRRSWQRHFNASS